MPRIEFQVGDVLDRLRKMPAESVHCVVTSPPYWGLRDYGVEGQLGLEPTVEEYVEKMTAVFHEVRRVLRTDGTLWLNMGDCYAHAGACGGGSPVDNATDARGPRPAKGRPSDRIAQNKTKGTRGNLKEKDLVGQPWRLAFALQADGWWLRSDIIWCLSGGARVYAKTQKGVMPTTVKDLVRLRPETVELWNGEKWTQCLGWNSSQFRAGALEIELRSGERIGSTPGHRWPTQRGLLCTRDLQLGDVIDVCRLPGRENLNPPCLRSTGWYMGHYLAEGSRSGDTIQIACHAQEKVELLKEWGGLAKAYGGSAHAHSTGSKAAVVCVESRIVGAILDQFIGGRTAKNKHLKPAAWRMNDLWLSDLLRGYLEGDGHYDKKNDRWRLGFTRNDAWAADLRTLGARLGCTVRLRPRIAKAGDKFYPCYRGEWRYNDSQHHNAKPNTQIVAIRRSRARQFWDIEVADEPHTFALASGVLTHNSKPNPMPESCRDRATKSHEYVFMLTKAARYFWDQEAVREPGVCDYADAATKRGKSWHKHDADGSRGAAQSTIKRDGVDRGHVTPAGGRNMRSVWTIPTQPFPAAHFATFPEELPRRCIAAGTSEKGCCPKCGAPWVRVVEREQCGKAHSDTKFDKTMQGGPLSGSRQAYRARGLEGPPPPKTTGWKRGCKHKGKPIPCTVLDPFSGAGTTGLVAVKMGRNFVGIDLGEKYVEMSVLRIKRGVPVLLTERRPGSVALTTRVPPALAADKSIKSIKPFKLEGSRRLKRLRVRRDPSK